MAAAGELERRFAALRVAHEQAAAHLYRFFEQAPEDCARAMALNRLHRACEEEQRRTELFRGTMTDIYARVGKITLLKEVAEMTTARQQDIVKCMNLLDAERRKLSRVLTVMETAERAREELDKFLRDIPPEVAEGLAGPGMGTMSDFC